MSDFYTCPITGVLIREVNNYTQTEVDTRRATCNPRRYAQPKLSKEQVARLLRMHEADNTLEEIAEYFSISTVTARHYLRSQAKEE